MSKECIIQDKLNTSATINCFNIYALEVLSAMSETPVYFFFYEIHILFYPDIAVKFYQELHKATANKVNVHK